MTVITISRQYGSGGDEIAQRIAEELRIPLFNKRQIIQAAASSGLSEQEIVDYSEDNHKVRGFMDRLFGRPATIHQTVVWKEDALGIPVAEEISLSDEVAVTLVQNAIQSAHRAGDIIIVGRGGQVILRGEKDVLHIRIEAPMEERLQRVKEIVRMERQVYFADIDIRREAQDLIQRRDEASADYIKRYYNEDWSNPLLYHLIINTGLLSIEQAVRLITQLAETIRQPEQVSF